MKIVPKLVLVFFLLQAWFKIFAQTSMPVELIYFRAEVSDSLIVLKWGTATEVNNYGFILERTDTVNINFEGIGFVSGHGNSNIPRDYVFNDEAAIPTEPYYYRLKQIDTDGAFDYSNIISVNIVTAVPEEINPEFNFFLNQNYPNPFNPFTKINFHLSKRSLVKLEVFDIAGRKISELINEEKIPGNYEIIFSADEFNLASGTYFYKISSPSFSETKKMVLLK